MQPEWSQSGDAGKVLIQSEETRAMLKGDRGDQSIYGCQTYAFRPGQPRNSGRLAISGEAAWFKHFP